MVKYCCDRCKKEVKSEKYLYPVKVQSYLRDDVTAWLPAVSICAECLNDLALFLGSGEPRDYSLLTEITETDKDIDVAETIIEADKEVEDGNS